MYGMKKYLIIIFILFFSCHKDPSSISNGPNPPREYVWTFDSLTIPNTFQITLNDIWGSSAKDVYVVGHSSGARGMMFHYDGKSWEPVKLHVVEGGPFPNIFEIWSIHGFSSTNVFAAGFKHGEVHGEFISFLIHFDGQQWTEIPLESKGLLAVWGLSPVDIWAGGIEGTLLHFDGNTWNKFSMPDSLLIKKFNGFAANDVNALAYSFDGTGRSYRYVLHWDGQEWKIRESFREHHAIPETFGTHGLIAIDNYLFSSGRGVFRKAGSDSSWVKIFNPPGRLYDIYGLSTDNIFTVGQAGKAYHYNGTDWYQYKEIEYPNIEYAGCWTDGCETFIVGDDGSKSYVLHGK